MTHLESFQCFCNSTYALEDDGIEPSASQQLSYLMDFHCADQLRSAPLHVEGVGRTFRWNSVRDYSDSYYVGR